MKILVDTNVVLDVLCDREKFADDSTRVIQFCEANLVSGSIYAMSVPNIVYIMRRELDPEAIETICLYLSLIFSIESLTSKDLRKAAQMRNKDFEDSLQMVCAEKISADYIVTRNIKDFALSKVPVITPAEFLNIMQKENDNN